MNGPRTTYFDHNASAPLSDAARAAIVGALGAGTGNASSPHAGGRRMRRILGDARERVAALVGAEAREIVFTSGATESNGLALRGALAAAGDGRRALVTTHAEHPSVALTAARLESEGVEVRRAGVDRFGRVAANDVAALCHEGLGDGTTALVAIVHGQPVTGALQPIEEIAAAIDVPLHVDAAQTAGRLPLDVRALGCSFLALSAHKIGGPQGIGALFVREGAAWRNPLVEGSQERGRRPGTEAVVLAAGFGAAAEEAARGVEAFARETGAALEPLRRFVAETPGAECWSPSAAALPNTCLVAFAGCRGDTLLAALDARGFCVSTGTACTSGARTPAEVLTAAGRSADDAARAVRVSIGALTRAEDVIGLCEAFRTVLPRVREAQATA